jgi:hypothetical protein
MMLWVHAEARGSLPLLLLLLLLPLELLLLLHHHLLLLTSFAASIAGAEHAGLDFLERHGFTSVLDRRVDEAALRRRRLAELLKLSLWLRWECPQEALHRKRTIATLIRCRPLDISTLAWPLLLLLLLLPVH